jgi:hypothetical protein
MGSEPKKPDPVRMLRELQESGQALDPTLAESYLAEVYEDRKRWRGGEPLQTIETAKGSLILLDPTDSEVPTCSNLLLVERGQIKWRAELPATHDSFVSVRLSESGDVTAHTWMGWVVQIDLNTGKTMKKEFVK